MKTANVAEAVKSEHAVALLKQMYGENRVEENAARYQLVADGFAKEFGDKAFEFFSAPGRTEIGGNHTDHNHGKVLAGSVHLDLSLIHICGKTDIGIYGYYGKKSYGNSMA